jgi:hypothetical protein
MSDVACTFNIKAMLYFVSKQCKPIFMNEASSLGRAGRAGMGQLYLGRGRGWRGEGSTRLLKLYITT